MSRAQGREEKNLCGGIFKVSTLPREDIMREHICKPEYNLQSFIRATRCLTPGLLLQGCTSPGPLSGEGGKPVMTTEADKNMSESLQSPCLRLRSLSLH